MLYTPHLEPFGLAAIEAMASGTPVVAVREAGPCETVVDGETGFLCERDPDAPGLMRFYAFSRTPISVTRMGAAARRSRGGPASAGIAWPSSFAGILSAAAEPKSVISG